MPVRRRLLGGVGGWPPVLSMPAVAAVEITPVERPRDRALPDGFLGTGRAGSGGFSARARRARVWPATPYTFVSRPWLESRAATAKGP